MRPITIERASTSDRALTSSRSGSFQSACASTKSIPCFAPFALDFSGSNSNGIGIEIIPLQKWNGASPSGGIAVEPAHNSQSGGTVTKIQSCAGLIVLGALAALGTGTIGHAQVV